MKRILIIMSSILMVSCIGKKSEQKKTNEFAIIIHGGAGTLLKKNITDEMENAYKEKLTQAIKKGHSILRKGGSSLDAVEKTIQIMEDSPLFNAGKGAVFSHSEENKLDASIMYGKTLNAGSVAGVMNVKNPISLARKVMEKSQHVMLSGEGALEFAKLQKDLEIVPDSYFYTEKRFKALQDIKDKYKTELEHDSKVKDEKFGTVGCVAIDKEGNISAGTSTGGLTNKRWDRIGDSPIIGAGTYAKNSTCGVSCTGWGEYFIRLQIAHDISALMEYKNISLEEATRQVIGKLTKIGGLGGVIALDKNGNMISNFNTEGMYRATADDKGNIKVAIYKVDKD